MRSTWALQDAKNRFSELVNEALEHGPQMVTRHGRPAVVVVAAKDFKAPIHRKQSLAEFLAQSPLGGINLDLGRSRERGRKVRL